MIKLKDLKIIEEKKVKEVNEVRKPKFMGMEEKDIYKIEYHEFTIYGYNKEGKEIYFENSSGFWKKRKYNKEGKEVYFENSNGYWKKREDGKKIEHINGKYYIDGKEAILKTKGIKN